MIHKTEKSYRVSSEIVAATFLRIFILSSEILPKCGARRAKRSALKRFLPADISVLTARSHLAVQSAAGALWLAMSAGVAVAQTSGNDPLGMDDAVRAAVQTHPSVRSAGEQVLQANEGVEAARSGYKPQITGGIETQNNNYRNSSYDSRHVFTAKLTGSQMLYDFGKVAGAKNKAQSGVRVSEAQVQLATDDIAMNTAQAWIDAHMQQSMVQIAREQLAAIMSLTTLVTERAEKGATTRSDVEQANSRVEAVRSQLLGAEAEAQRASLALMHLTGRTAPVVITGDMPRALSAPVACRTGVGEETPAVRFADARRDEVRDELSIARADRKPTVSLDGSLGQALTKGSRLYGDYGTTGQVGVNLSMPLYQGGGMQARERAAIYQLRAFEDMAQQARLEMRQGFADARTQVDGWAQRVPVLQSRVESLDATRELYRQQYLQLATRSLLDLLNAEQEYLGARMDQTHALHAQYRLAVQCLYYSDRLRSSFGLDDAKDRISGGDEK